MVKINFKKLISATLIATQLLMPISYVLSLSDIMFQTVTKEVEIDNVPPIADFGLTKRESVDVIFGVGTYDFSKLNNLKLKAEIILREKFTANNIDANVNVNFFQRNFKVLEINNGVNTTPHVMGEYGLGFVSTECITMENFRNNIGNYQNRLDEFDVVIIGYDDSYQVLGNPNQSAGESIERFIKKGGGVLFTHDTLGTWYGSSIGNIWERDYTQPSSGGSHFDGGRVDYAPAYTTYNSNFTIEFEATPFAATQNIPESNFGDYSGHGLSYPVSNKDKLIVDAAIQGEVNKVGVGIALGTNGIYVIQHRSNVYASLLSYQADLSGKHKYRLEMVNNKPTLYIDDILVRTGIQSSYTTIAGPASGIGRGSYGSYQGHLYNMKVWQGTLVKSGFDRFAPYLYKTNPPPATDNSWYMDQVYKSMDGSITNYPYVLPASFSIQGTHSQYGYVRDDTQVWFKAPNGTANPRDYYIISNKNVIFNASGHQDLRYAPEWEKKLLVNTIFYASQFKAPSGTIDSIIKRHTWQEGANRFAAIINNDSLDELTDPSLSNPILATLQKEDINFSMLGTNTNQAQFNDFRSKVDNKGNFFDNANIDQALNEYADFVVNQVKAKQTPVTQYLLLNDIVKYKVNYSDYENDPQFNIHNWKYYHDEFYFENNLGRIQEHDQWRDGTALGGITEFRRTGKFIVDYKTKDNPIGIDERFEGYRKWSSMPNGAMTMYVHRKPLAEAKFSVTKTNPTMTVKFTSNAYDLDHQSMPNKGLRAKEWYYKPVGAVNWIPGGNTETFQFVGNVTTDYLVKHRVQDIDGENGIGVWSDDNIILVTTKPLPPIASFQVSPITYPIRSQLSITDNSYDPNGDTLVEYQWVFTDPLGVQRFVTPQLNGSGVTKAQTDVVCNQIKSAIDSFGHAAYGEWKISLKVRDNTGDWSNPLAVSDMVVRTITVVPNNGQPTISINPTDVFVDGENLVDTDNLANPLNKFITWNPIVSDSDIDNKGFQYKWDLEHFEADDGKVIRSHSDTAPTDKVKEYNYSTSVPFSNKSFKEQSLKPGPYKATATVTDIPTYGQPYAASVTKKFYVVPNINGTSQILHDKEEILCGDTVTLRVNTDYITDAVQVKVLSDTVDLVKVSGSNGNAVWEASYTIPELSDTQDVNFKFTLSTYFGSQDIYGNPNTVTRIKTINQTVNVIALKLEDFRITEMVNHDYYNYSYPIFKENMPVDYIAGYYVTFRIDAKGDPTQVISKVSTDGGSTSTNLEFTKTGVNGAKSIWQARYFIEPSALEGTVITNDITAYKNTTTYNYNTKEVWDGETLRVVSGLEKDIIIKRTN